MTADIAETIARVRELDAKATPGPWQNTPSIPPEGYECFWLTACPAPNQDREVATVSGPQNERNTANAELIAFVRTHLTDLLDAAEAGMRARALGFPNTGRIAKFVARQIRDEVLEECKQIVRPYMRHSTIAESILDQIEELRRPT